MIVDTSVFAAVLFEEADRQSFFSVMASAANLSISAGNWLELTVVLTRRGRHDLLPAAEQLRGNFGIVVRPTTPAQAELARAAYLRFGKGSGSPARLNFGDCFAYALAIESGEPLLFKGDGFRHTDVTAALPA